MAPGVRRFQVQGPGGESEVVVTFAGGCVTYRQNPALAHRLRFWSGLSARWSSGPVTSCARPFDAGLTAGSSSTPKRAANTGGRSVVLYHLVVEQDTAG
jgi:hypothetical protein